MGMDVVGVRTVARIHADDLPRSTACRSSAVTSACCAGARGQWRRAPSGRRSATGTCRSAGRSSAGLRWRWDARTMCRHVAWLGEPRTIASLVLDPPCGLLRQSYAPRRQKRGLMNADGWGVGFTRGRSAPVRWRSTRPLWSDASFASVAPALSAGRCLPPYGPRRRACRSRNARPPRSPTVIGCCRTTVRSTARAPGAPPPNRCATPRYSLRMSSPKARRGGGHDRRRRSARSGRST